MHPRCDSSTNEDVFGGLTFKTSHPINETDYRSALVRKAAFHQSHPETGADGKDIVVEVVAEAGVVIGVEVGVGVLETVIDDADHDAGSPVVGPDTLDVGVDSGRATGLGRVSEVPPVWLERIVGPQTGRAHR